MQFQLVAALVLVGLALVSAEEKDKRGLSNLGYGHGSADLSGYGGYGLGQQNYVQGGDHSEKKVAKVETYLRQEFLVPIPYPQPVKVVKNVPVPYPVAVKVPVDHPVPVHVFKPYPVPVEKAVPYPVERNVPVPVQVPVHVPYPVKFAVPVEKPYPVPVTKNVPYVVRQPVYVEKRVPVFVKEQHYDGGYAGAEGGFANFAGGHGGQYGNGNQLLQYGHH